MSDCILLQAYVYVRYQRDSDGCYRSEAGRGRGYILPAADSDFRGRQILLVEDNELNREIAVALLSEYGCLLYTSIIIQTERNGL